MHCWTSTRSCTLTSPLTSLKYVTPSKLPKTTVHFYPQWFISLSGPPADSEDSVSVWSRAPSPLRGTTLEIFIQLMTHSSTSLIMSFSMQGEENIEAQHVFALCLHAELVPATVQDYREKLLHLRKLRHDLVQRSLPQWPPTTSQQVLLRKGYSAKNDHLSRFVDMFRNDWKYFSLFICEIFLTLTQGTCTFRYLCVTSSQCSMSTSGLCGMQSLSWLCECDIISDILTFFSCFTSR